MYAAFFQGSVSECGLFSACHFYLLFYLFRNLGRMEAVRAFCPADGKNGMLTAVLSSQVISNVPAAVLLSSFTENWKALLLGTNLGGLGTPIASLASLISLKFYLKTEQADLKSYLLLFLSLNRAGCSFFWRLLYPLNSRTSSLNSGCFKMPA